MTEPTRIDEGKMKTKPCVKNKQEQGQESTKGQRKISALKDTTEVVRLLNQKVEENKAHHTHQDVPEQMMKMNPHFPLLPLLFHNSQMLIEGAIGFPIYQDLPVLLCQPLQADPQQDQQVQDQPRDEGHHLLKGEIKCHLLIGKEDHHCLWIGLRWEKGSKVTGSTP